MKKVTARITGFTLFELLAVLLLVGILAAYVAPKLNLTAFRHTGFFQQATAAIRFAQKSAIASNCDVTVNITAGGCTLDWAGTGAPMAVCPGAGTDIENPASGSTDFCADSDPESNPAGDTSFDFDNIGRPVPNTTQTIIIGSQTITVETETGFTH